MSKPTKTLTLRLDAKTAELLDDLSKHLGINTGAGTIQYLITSHFELCDNLAKWELRAKKSKSQLESLTDDLDGSRDLLRALLTRLDQKPIDFGD